MICSNDYCVLYVCVCFNAVTLSGHEGKLLLFLSFLCFQFILYISYLPS